MTARALLDRSVEANLCLIEAVEVARPIKWGKTEQILKQVGYRLKQDLDKRGKWHFDQIKALPSIAHLNATGLLSLHTYGELNYESWPVGANIIARSRGDLRTQIKTSYVKAAVEPSFFFQSTFPPFNDNRPFHIIRDEMLGKFFNMLATLKYEEIEAIPELIERFDEFTRTNLSNLERFRQLCTAVGDEHYRDAFHLWTAETNNLDYFLTMDRRFINVLTQTAQIPLTTIPISPNNLVKKLGITELIPIPLDPEKIYNLLEEG